MDSKRTADNATASSSGLGNLVGRGKPEDIKSVWEGTKAVDARVGQLPDVIQDARATADRGALDPRVRDYVKRYFSTDNP